jgi:hypothetical protein
LKNGDISNETPPRIIVNIDLVVTSEITETKKLLRGTTNERKVTGLVNPALQQLWTIANRFGLSVELAAFEDDFWQQEHLDKLMDRMDNRGGNPFNYAELYSNLDDFIGELPYRSNLKGVVDLRERVARYGSWGIELQNL